MGSITPANSGNAIDTITWGTIATAALFNTAEERYNQTIENIPLLKLLQTKRSVAMDGGEYIKRDVTFGESDNVGAFSKFDQLNLATFDNRLPTKWEWKNIYAAIKIAEEDTIITKTSDIGATLNLLTEGVDYAMRGLRKKLNKWLWEDGSGEGYKVPLGIEALVSTTPTTGVLAHLDRATYTWWRNSAINANGTWKAKGIGAVGATSDIEDKFLVMWNDLKIGNEYPNVIFSHPDLQEWYERTIPDYFHINASPNGDFDFGYSTLTYKGMPWYVDYDCPYTASTDGRAYMLRLDDFQFVVSSEWNFKSTGFISLRSAGIMADACFILLRCNLICLKPSNQGVIYGYTTFG